MQNKNKLLLIAGILGIAYLIYSMVYWSGAATTPGTDAEQAGTAIASLLVMPHLLFVGLAVLFNIIGFFTNKAGFALTAGILYAVAMLLFVMYFFFVVVQCVLCFVAFAQMRKKTA